MIEKTCMENYFTKERNIPGVKFSVILADGTTNINATFYRDAATRFYHLVNVGEVRLKKLVLQKIVWSNFSNVNSFFVLF